MATAGENRFQLRCTHCGEWIATVLEANHFTDAQTELLNDYWARCPSCAHIAFLDVGRTRFGAHQQTPVAGHPSPAS
jgi:hypothetical protein